MFSEMDVLLLMIMSDTHSVYNGSYSLILGAVYSDTLRKPWNAVNIAAHSMPLSVMLMDEFHRL